MTSEDFLNEYLEKKLIKAEKVGFDQIEKVMKSAEKDLKVSEKLLAIDEGHAYETAYTARCFMRGEHSYLLKVSVHQQIFSIKPLLIS